jgi:hypothetical protein
MSVKGDTKRTQGITGLLCSWVYKYDDMTLQVGGISNETVKYGYGFLVTQVRELIHCKYRSVLWSERAPKEEVSKQLSVKTRGGGQLKSGHGPNGCPTPRRTGRLIVSHNLTLTSTNHLQWHSKDERFICIEGKLGLGV